MSGDTPEMSELPLPDGSLHDDETDAAEVEEVPNTVRPTRTSDDQEECEQTCSQFFLDFDGLPEDQARRLQAQGLLSETRAVRLMRDKHVGYLLKVAKTKLTPRYPALASHPRFPPRSHNAAAAPPLRAGARPAERELRRARREPAVARLLDPPFARRACASLSSSFAARRASRHRSWAVVPPIESSRAVCRDTSGEPIA
jgi:hypothetical protein